MSESESGKRRIVMRPALAERRGKNKGGTVLPREATESEPVEENRSVHGQRILVPKNGTYFVCGVAGGNTAIFRDAQNRLALFRNTYAKYHLNPERMSDYTKGAGFPKDCDFVLLFKDYLGHRHNDRVYFRNRGREIPIITTVHKWTKMCAALHNYGLKAGTLPEGALYDVDRPLRERIAAKINLPTRERVAALERELEREVLPTEEVAPTVEAAVEAAVTQLSNEAAQPVVLNGGGPLEVPLLGGVRVPRGPIRIEVGEAEVVLMLLRAAQQRLKAGGIKGVILDQGTMNIEWMLPEPVVAPVRGSFTVPPPAPPQQTAEEAVTNG